MSTDSELDVENDVQSVGATNNESIVDIENVTTLEQNNCVKAFGGSANLQRRRIRRLLSQDSGEPGTKRPKLPVDPTVPNVSFKDFRGLPDVLRAVSELVVHIRESEVYRKLGVVPPRGFLLHGPPGCGKTLLARAVAGELGVPLFTITGPEMVPSLCGPTDYKVKNFFEAASEKTPCVIFIDKVEVVGQKREAANKAERRVTEVLLGCIDELSTKEAGTRVTVIGATTSPELLDPAFRTPGRFDREIHLTAPDRNGRREILHYLTSGMKVREGCSLEAIADGTPGFLGADLKSLTTEAGIAAVNRALDRKNRRTPELGSSNKQLMKSQKPQFSSEEIDDLCIEQEDFTRALKCVQPSTKREGFVTVPRITWNDVGSLQDVRKELHASILLPVKRPEECAVLGINRPTGILLWGPPGCGKTLLAKAVANEADINFISVKGPELLSMYVGESERAIRSCFQRAKNSQPCIIFFDEIDALCPTRSSAIEGSNITARVVNQVLTEMDGIEERRGVFVLAATNRPDILDPALLRPGRLDKTVFVGIPEADGRVDILRTLTKNGSRPPMTGVDLEAVGRDSALDGYTGADLAALVKEASVIALTEHMERSTPLAVTTQMLYDALSRLRPSVSPKYLELYNDKFSFYQAEKKGKSSVGIP